MTSVPCRSSAVSSSSNCSPLTKVPCIDLVSVMMIWKRIVSYQGGVRGKKQKLEVGSSVGKEIKIKNGGQEIACIIIWLEKEATRTRRPAANRKLRAFF